MSPYFTIIIPTFNSGKNLTVSLLSIANQTFNNIEVVIIDGDSNDDTLIISESFNNKIKHINIFSEKDSGIYDAMNKGMDKAKGEWLFFMGSDDTIYANDVLENTAKFLSSTDAKVVYGNVHIIGNTGWANNGDIYAGEFDIFKLLNQNICHQSIFYNRAFIKNRIGYFNLDYKKSSDWDFNLRCWAIHSFEYMDAIIANFLAGGFSTHSTDTRIIEDFLDNILEYFKVNPFHPLVNNPNFIFYDKVIIKQREDYAFRYNIEKLKRRIVKKLSLK